MSFELWSFWHFLYLASPFVLFMLIYLLVAKCKPMTKIVVGIILGGISLYIIVIRNVDIFLRSGWDLEVIPLQVCHIGSIISGLALVLRKRWLILTSFCFNIIPAFLAMVFASALANYDTILKIRPQTYIWGHIFIIVCALYGIFVMRPKFTKKDLIYSLSFVSSCSLVAIICNSLFRFIFNWEPNYFYLFNYDGTPLKFLYCVVPTSTYGWFQINWFYTLTLFGFFLLVFLGMFFLAKLLVKIANKKKIVKGKFSIG